MRKVLLISAHCPPDSAAATHRVRLLAPHLPSYGWEPTVLTVDPTAYTGGIDQELPKMIPASLRIERAPAWSPRLTRLVGIGDLGLRSFVGLHRHASRLLRREPFDALFITIFPAYSALLGPSLARRFQLPFVLDYQDPWVGAWGTTVGGGRGGRVDLKSRASLTLAKWLEPYAVRAATAITAVSAGTWQPILQRNPGIQPITEVIPIGVEPLDFATRGQATSQKNPIFDPDDGLVHVCYVGAMLPLGFETLRAFLVAVRLLRDRRPDLYRRLRLHFVGTSNQTSGPADARVLPEAAAAGVDEIVTETPLRVPYSQAVLVQRDATVLLALGSSESHYTASKIYPMLHARRPLLAVYHGASTVVAALKQIGGAPSVQLVTYDDAARAGQQIAAIAEALTRLVENPIWREVDINHDALNEFAASRLAGRLASVLDRATDRVQNPKAA